MKLNMASKMKSQNRGDCLKVATRGQSNKVENRTSSIDNLSYSEYVETDQVVLVDVVVQDHTAQGDDPSEHC